MRADHSPPGTGTLIHQAVTLRLVGDGKLRAEECAARAIESMGRSSSVQAAFLDHPILSTTTPERLLGKVSRKRASRLLASGLLGDCGEEDSIFQRGRIIEESLPLSMILTELGLLPPSPVNAPVTVLFENESFIAIDKPHDLPSAPLGSDETDSAVQRVLAKIPNLPILRDNPLEPGLVHRLDTGTSGVLLFAKSLAAFERIQKTWNSGEVRKVYLAQTTQRPSATGRLELLLGHDAKSKKKMRVIRGAQDRKLIRGDASPAVSEILRLAPMKKGNHSSPERFEVEIRIETGVHHQIRATLAHLRAPIAGDPHYGGSPDERMWLHAWKLVLTDEGKKMEIIAPRPERWETG